MKSVLLQGIAELSCKSLWLSFSFTAGVVTEDLLRLDAFHGNP